MASSNRRKKQNRAKAAAKHAEARRRQAATARIRAVQARLTRMYDPGTSGAELAILLAEHYQGVPVAGWLASALLREGSSLARLQDAVEQMLTSQDAPSLTALTFAAAVAGAAGDAGQERHLIDQALAAVEAGDPDVRLEVVDFISTSGHAADAVELLEPATCTARRSNGPTPQPAQMKPPLVSVPQCAGSPTARAWSRSRTPSAPSWTAPSSARRSGRG
jgi:hypothetical protein